MPTQSDCYAPALCYIGSVLPSSLSPGLVPSSDSAVPLDPVPAFSSAASPDPVLPFGSAAPPGPFGSVPPFLPVGSGMFV